METKPKNSSGINAASQLDGNSILIIHILDLQTNDLIIKRLKGKKHSISKYKPKNYNESIEVLIY
jgi:hypothetical protein